MFFHSFQCKWFIRFPLFILLTIPLLVFQDKPPKAFSPGKLDFLHRHTESSDHTNLIWWTPFIKGGAGQLDLESGNTDTSWFGTYIRPLQATALKDELILGYLRVENGNRKASEAQAEYRFAFGLGIGAGKVEQDQVPDLKFTKLSYRNKRGGLNYIVSLQRTDYDLGQEDFGGFLAFYNERFMLVGGDDGEHNRFTFGYIGKKDARFRPALEILRVDNSTGNQDGSIFTFINSTLNFKGGFLSHSARLGRAMGPAGLEYGNPLGFLRPTWNRRLDPWELGGALNFRAIRLELPNGSENRTYEAVMFPFQFNQQSDNLDRFFLGTSVQEIGDNTQTTVLGGVMGTARRLRIILEAEFNLDTDKAAGNLGLIWKL